MSLPPIPRLAALVFLLAAAAAPAPGELCVFGLCLDGVEDLARTPPTEATTATVPTTDLAGFDWAAALASLPPLAATTSPATTTTAPVDLEEQLVALGLGAPEVLARHRDLGATSLRQAAAAELVWSLTERRPREPVADGPDFEAFVGRLAQHLAGAPRGELDAAAYKAALRAAAAALTGLRSVRHRVLVLDELVRRQSGRRHWAPGGRPRTAAAYTTGYGQLTLASALGQLRPGECLFDPAVNLRLTARHLQRRLTGSTRAALEAAVAAYLGGEAPRAGARRAARTLVARVLRRAAGTQAPRQRTTRRTTRRITRRRRTRPPAPRRTPKPVRRDEVALGHTPGTLTTRPEPQRRSEPVVNPLDYLNRPARFGF